MDELKYIVCQNGMPATCDPTPAADWTQENFLPIQDESEGRVMPRIEGECHS